MIYASETVAEKVFRESLRSEYQILKDEGLDAYENSNKIGILHKKITI